MKYIKIDFFLIAILVTVLAFSCKNQNDSAEPTETQTVELGMAEEVHSKGDVHLSIAQMKAIGLKTAKLSMLKTSGFFAANGVIDLPPSSVATVNSKAEAFVKEFKNLVIGSYVKKGQVLAVLEHPDFLFKQQEFLELGSQLDWLEKEFERQNSLKESNAGTLKAFQKAKMDLEICRSKLTGISQYLNYIGIDAANISSQNFQKYTYLRSPISGFISAIFINQGKHVSPDMVLLEIVNNHHVHLELNVFEKDIAKVTEGQKVTFSIPSYGLRQFEAKVHEIGRTLNEVNKAIVVHCHLVGSHPEFVQGIFAKAKIWNDQETVLSLPESAVIKEDQSAFVFEKTMQDENEAIFKAVPIRVGKKDGNLVEIIAIEGIDENAEFVVEGGYYLNAELNAEEGGGHSH